MQKSVSVQQLSRVLRQYVRNQFRGKTQTSASCRHLAYFASKRPTFKSRNPDSRRWAIV